ncbi:MAG TPA: hypothetical protein VMT00_11780 [Thermoanaerobaculia bacterium]|nr:hypothetical protein [Thermoanaerobaculia bacterium]
MKKQLAGICFLSMFFATTCATGSGKGEPTRLLGQENQIRVDAEVIAPTLTTAAVVLISYDVHNLREAPIAIADMVPYTSYDSETQTVTVSFGAEVPGNQLLPRLLLIPAGEKRTFRSKAQLNFLVTEQHLSPPRYLQLRVNVLEHVTPFKDLLDISETAISNAKLAEELFPKWIEHNVTIRTNSMPVRWQPSTTPFQGPTPPRRGRTGLP